MLSFWFFKFMASLPLCSELCAPAGRPGAAASCRGGLLAKKREKAPCQEGPARRRLPPPDIAGTGRGRGRDGRRRHSRPAPSHRVPAAAASPRPAGGGPARPWGGAAAVPPPGGGPRERGHGAGGAAISLGALIGEKELREEPQPALRGGGGTGPACLAARPPPPRRGHFPASPQGSSGRPRWGR